MGDHDAISDNGTTVECNCGRRYEGPKARDQHITHQHIERARAALHGEKRDA